MVASRKQGNLMQKKVNSGSRGGVNFNFEFMDNLEQLRNRIPDAQFVKLTFPLIITFYLTKQN